MSYWADVATVATGLNVVLLLGLGYVWGRNWLRMRSKHTTGLVIFAFFLLAENALELYYYSMDPTLASWFANDAPSVLWRAMMALDVLQTAGLLFLAWITWD
jgi:hypothetical protein